MVLRGVSGQDKADLYGHGVAQWFKSGFFGESGFIDCRFKHLYSMQGIIPSDVEIPR